MRTSEVVEDILAHHGVKGQRWGVRRKRTSGTQAVTVTDKRKKLKTSGGKGFPAHADAVRARTVAQVAKKSGYKSVSNRDLQDYNTRLNLEMNAKRLSYQDKSAGKRFVLTLIGKNVGKGVEAGGKAVIGSAAFRRRAAIGATALALA